MSENDIQNTVLEYLNLNKKIKGYFFWRANTIGVYDSVNKSFRRLPKYTIKGAPDINLIWNGQYIGLEIKQKGTYQSKEQKEFEQFVKDVGGEYYVIRSIDNLKEIGL